MRGPALALVVAFAVTLVVVPTPAHAACTVPHTTPTLTVQSVTTGSATSGGGATLGVPAVPGVPILQASTWYVLVDAHSFFVYEETNDISGLQRDDFARDDTCGGAAPPDVNVL